MKWDDVKVFLSVAQAGSTLAASKSLGVNQSTVSRRIDALERTTGLTLFRRELSGYRLTPDGERLVEVCQPALAVFDRIGATARQLASARTERIRITGPAETINHWVYPILNRFRAANPGVDMEVDTSEAQADLLSGEMDLAVRLTDEIEDDRLIARRIAAVPWAVFCSRRYEAAQGIPRDTSEIAGHAVIHYADRVARRIQPIRKLGEYLSEDQIRLRVSSVPGMVTALKTELAIGILPKVVGDNTPELVPCFRDEAFRHNCWVVASAEAYARPIVRKCMKQIADEFPRGSL